MQHLSEKQGAYVIRCFAFEMKVREVVNNFKQVYPCFGADIEDPEALDRRLYERFKKIKQTHAEEISQERLRDPDGTWHLPMTYPHVQLIRLQQMFDAIPIKTLQRTFIAPDGKEHKVYKYNVMEKLKILRRIRSLCQELGLVYLYYP